MKFLPCTHPGCNRKYGTEKKWALHLSTVHSDDKDPVLPNWVEIDKTAKRKNSSLLEIQRSEKLLLEATARKEAEVEAREKLAEKHGALVYETDEQALEIRKRIKEGVSECPVCMERPPDGVIMPCKHAMFCQQCVSALTKCPLCRAAIENVIGVYF